MIQQQRPPFVFMNGRITPWEDATIHVSNEAVTRGISVFEGIKGYWCHDGTEFRLLALREHYDRLVRSARLAHVPFTMHYEDFGKACVELVKRLLSKDRDLWLRTTLLSVEGQWGEGTVSDLVITCYHQDKKRPSALDVGISTWQRPMDTCLPARVKSAANYQTGRLARIEGRRQGFGDMVLLNQWGRVAEATGSCLLLVRRGKLVTPPPSEGCLESITVNIVEGLCGSRSVPFERRPLDRTELCVADEACLAGTLMELGLIRRIESYALPDRAPILEGLTNDFWDCVRGLREHPAIALTPV
jgi:branched-chain amino acid aminotransferase